jgi:hypothetical protein
MKKHTAHIQSSKVFRPTFGEIKWTRNRSHYSWFPLNGGSGAETAGLLLLTDRLFVHIYIYEPTLLLLLFRACSITVIAYTTTPLYCWLYPPTSSFLSIFFSTSCIVVVARQLPFLSTLLRDTLFALCATSFIFMGLYSTDIDLVQAYVE